MTNIKAATIHLVLSIIIVSVVVLTMYFLWFPGEYFSLLGGKKLILTIAFADILLGPLLTLVVFKSEKKSLKSDLTFIGILQLIAICYGIHVTFQARPVFTVFNRGAFYVASQVDIVPDNLQKAKKEKWRTLSISGPTLVATIQPGSGDKYEAMFEELESATRTTQRYPILYDEYHNHTPAVIKAGKPLQDLASISPQNKRAVENFFKKYEGSSNNFLFLPITSAITQMSAVVDAETGEFVQIINASPFPDKLNENNR